MTTLLPPNATASEIALDETLERIVIPVEINKLWDVASCPVDLLPWLAWSLSLDEWDDSWNETIKRQYIADSYKIHSHKGTPYSIKVALQALGYEDVIIREGRVDYYNGVYKYDGSIDYGSNQTWPLFDVLINIGYVPDSAKIAEIRKRIERYKNERSVLRNLIFMNLLYDGATLYDDVNRYNAGVV